MPYIRYISDLVGRTLVELWTCPLNSLDPSLYVGNGAHQGCVVCVVWDETNNEHE